MIGEKDYINKYIKSKVAKVRSRLSVSHRRRNTQITKRKKNEYYSGAYTIRCNSRDKLGHVTVTCLLNNR